MRRLPAWKGYTVDARLSEFRKVSLAGEPSIEFIPFDSPKGRKMLRRMRDEGNPLYSVKAFPATPSSPARRSIPESAGTKNRKSQRVSPCNWGRRVLRPRPNLWRR
jgi:hypothetical protein